MIIAVTVNGSVDVLMDGIITKQDVTPTAGRQVDAHHDRPRPHGADGLHRPDRDSLSRAAEFVIVEAILAKYAVLGVVPLALPASIPLREPARAIRQAAGDRLRYVTALAQETGAVFYLDPGPKPGMSLAYWGPDLSKMFGGPQPALSINFDATTNIDSLRSPTTAPWRRSTS